MAKRVGVDKWLFCVTLLLTLLGLTMVFSASAVMAQERFHSAYTFVIRQGLWGLGGILAMIGLMKVDYRHYRRPAIVYAALAITTASLVLPFLMGRSHNTYRWIHVGALSFQPSELAKLVIVLFLAFFLETRMRQMDDVRNTLVPAVVPTLIFSALILRQPDLGTTAVCVATTAIILYVAGMDKKWLGYALIPIAPILYLLLFHVAWRRQRMLAFINPWADPQGSGFHIIQSLLAVGSGGITGVGLMEGKQKLFYLPEGHTDFIFANLAEEFGLIGTVTVVVLFAVFCYRGLRAAILSQDPFARFLALGITASVIVQALFNISVVLALLPTKGIPLPFISYGGSSLFITLAAVGVLLNITRETE